MKNLTNQKSGIYIITNLINNKYYIGSTTDFKSRCRSHRTLLKRNKHFNTHLQASVNKYGLDNFTFNSLEEILIESFNTKEEFIQYLNTREEFYITSMNSTNHDFGYNARTDCSTNLGLKWPEKSRIKFSKSKKGKPLPPNTLKAVREAAKRRVGIPNSTLKDWYNSLTQEQKLAFKEKRIAGAKRLKQARLKLKQETGELLTPEQLLHVRESKKCRTVYCYTLLGEYVDSFPTLSRTQKFLKNNTKNTSGIRNSIDNTIYHGYFFNYTQYDILPYSLRKKYLDNTNKITQIRSVNQYDLNHNFIKRWDSINEAALSLGYTKSTPLRNKIVKNESINNYYFEYVEPYSSDCIGKPDELLESLEIDNQQPSQPLTKLEGSETNS